jgi:hypothetical protein
MTTLCRVLITISILFLSGVLGIKSMTAQSDIGNSLGAKTSTQTTISKSTLVADGQNKASNDTNSKQNANFLGVDVGIIAAVIALISAITVAVMTYISNRNIERLKIEFSKEDQYRKYLMQRLNSFAEKYYIPLANSALQARIYLRMAQLLPEESNIRLRCCL